VGSGVIRLFYCPICGNRIPLEKSDTRFYKKSPAEVAKLSERFAGITAIDLAIQKFGRPDFDRGRVVDISYPKGKRTRSGYKRAIFYDRLARTVTVMVSEELDGRVIVRFYPKEKSRTK